MAAQKQGGPRVAFVTLGCKVNQAESDALAASIPVEALAADAVEADIVVVNTCTVTSEADHKARKAVRRALASPQRPTVFVTGCLAAVDGEAMRAFGERVVVEPDKERLRERIASVGLTDRAAPRDRAPQKRVRVQLKVQDGCDTGCAYCIIPRARGLPRAVPLEEVIQRAEQMVAQGAAEIVVTGINIGRYEDRGAKLGDLLRAVAATGVARVRLSSIEPNDLDDSLLGTLASMPAFCRHLHVPLQSGSDEVLARMGRPYDTAAFGARVQAARAALPGVALTTDVIAGFPGETSRDHAKTCAFVEKTRFARLHVFRFSARPGTRAAHMGGQVPAGVMAERAAELRALGQRLARKAAVEREGRCAELLVERVARSGAGRTRLVEGTTREYERVRAPHPSATPGMLLQVRLGGPDATASVRGMVESS